MNTEELRQAVNKYCEETHQGNFDAGLDIGVSQWTLRKFRLGGEVTPRTLQKIEKFFSTETDDLKVENQRLKTLNKILDAENEEYSEKVSEVITYRNALKKIQQLATKNVTFESITKIGQVAYQALNI